MNCFHIAKCRKGRYENEYLHTLQEIYLTVLKYIFFRCLFYEDILKTIKIHLMYCEDIRPHSYLSTINNKKTLYLSQIRVPPKNSIFPLDSVMLFNFVSAAMKLEREEFVIFYEGGRKAKNIMLRIKKG